MSNANKLGSESAFGFVDNRSSSYEDNEVHYGLTKREYFAAMAMQGLMANSNVLSNDGKWNFDKEAVALNCTIMADALLTQLSLNK